MTACTRNSQRGSAMLVTLILISALLAGVAVLVSLQLASTKSTELQRSGLAALHCAEAGLAVTHNEVAQNRTLVDAHLLANPASLTVQPAFLVTTLTAPTQDLNDIDGDGQTDFQIFIVDNDDEPTGNDYRYDTDGRVWLVSTCIKYTDTPKQVRELVEYAKNPTMYDWQDGRGFGNNNANSY